MKSHFSMLAAYNRWANVRLYRMAAALPDDQYRRDVGLYFRSLHGTLNHLLVADRIWMRRLDRTGDHPDRLNAIVHDDLAALKEARRAEDERIIRHVDSLSGNDFDTAWEYTMLTGVSQRQPIGQILAHLFNHQAHHRGQAHAALTILGVVEPEPLDLLIMLREAAPGCGR